MRSTTCKDITELPLSIQTATRERQEMYVRLLSEGHGHKWAEMCALQIAPGTKGTDRAFMEGRYNNQQLDSMPTKHAQNIVTLARRAGINPSGKYYASSLADRRGVQDPAAWISGVDDVTRVARERNLTVTGAVEHKGAPVPRPASKPLSERLTREMMRRERPNHPNMKSGELREMVVAKYGRKVKK